MTIRHKAFHRKTAYCLYLWLLKERKKNEGSGDGEERNAAYRYL